ncbi:MAG: Fe-S cluster assembly sulfur transfer protein SufU [Thermoplasmatota archaeon]
MGDDLRELYQQVIMDHNKHPRNRGPVEGADHHADGQNPLCGDTVTVHLKLAGDGQTVEAAGFEGHGCAISTASASMMTEALRGRPVDEAKALFDSFHALVTRDADKEPDTALLGKLKVFAGVGEFPARVKCASLAWHTMNAALDGGGSVSTE